MSKTAWSGSWETLPPTPTHVARNDGKHCGAFAYHYEDCRCGGFGNHCNPGGWIWSCCGGDESSTWCGLSGPPPETAAPEAAGTPAEPPEPSELTRALDDLRKRRRVEALVGRPPSALAATGNTPFRHGVSAEGEPGWSCTRFYFEYDGLYFCAVTVARPTGDEAAAFPDAIEKIEWFGSSAAVRAAAQRLLGPDD